jgi:hypothetical protein
MSDEMKALLLRQFDTAWKLAYYHLDGLGTDECLWRPAPAGMMAATGAPQSDADWWQAYSHNRPRRKWQ